MSAKKNTRKKNSSEKVRAQPSAAPTTSEPVSSKRRVKVSSKPSLNTSVSAQVESEKSTAFSEPSFEYAEKSRKAHKQNTFANLLKNPQAQNILISVISSTVSIAALLWFAFGFIPYVYDQTSDAKQAVASSSQRAEERRNEEEKAKIQNLLTDENKRLVFTNQKVKLTTNYGDLKVTLLDKNAPITVENFIRLTDRKNYKDVKFHRFLKESDFAILQGGDYESQNGSGGKSAFGTPLNDEIWTTPPALDDKGSATNDPVFKSTDGYVNYNKERNFVTIPKGYLAMANSGPNTAGSQFFITLKDTQITASYTVFGKIDANDFAVLDKILNDVEAVKNDSGTASDKPSKDIILVQSTIVS